VPSKVNSEIDLDPSALHTCWVCGTEGMVRFRVAEALPA
jgi:hypothetical protein